MVFGPLVSLVKPLIPVIFECIPVWFLSCDVSLCWSQFYLWTADCWQQLCSPLLLPLTSKAQTQSDNNTTSSTSSISWYLVSSVNWVKKYEKQISQLLGFWLSIFQTFVNLSVAILESKITWFFLTLKNFCFKIIKNQTSLSCC